MPTNTDTDQVGTLITTEFGTSPLSFPKGLTNVAPYVYGSARTYAGVTEEPATLDGPFDEVAPVEEEISAPVGDTPWPPSVADTEDTVVALPEEANDVPGEPPASETEETASAPVVEPDTSIQTDVESEVKRVEAEAEKIAEDLKVEAEKVIADVEAEAKKVGL